jgi:hypothetical protein
MWYKYIGFALLFAVVVLLIRPDLIWGPKNVSLEQSDTTSGDKVDNDYQDPRRPSLLVNDKSKIKDGYTEYAEGYSEKDFDALKEPEEMFKTREEVLGQSAGGLWEIFLKLRFDITYDAAIDDVAMRPMFTPEIKKYDNKIIEMVGYIIPNDIVHGAVGERGNGTMFMLSAFPTATCFFCKGAGPESVMEVYPKKPIPFSKTVVKIRGRLELNELDYMKMAYLLKDAQLVE